MANLYSRFGRYPVFTVKLWYKHAVPYIDWLTEKCRREKVEDVEQGTAPTRPTAMPRTKSTMKIPKRIEAQVGYGLASAAMLPAIM